MDECIVLEAEDAWVYHRRWGICHHAITKSQMDGCTVGMPRMGESATSLSRNPWTDGSTAAPPQMGGSTTASSRMPRMDVVGVDEVNVAALMLGFGFGSDKGREKEWLSGG